MDQGTPQIGKRNDPQRTEAVEDARPGSDVRRTSHEGHRQGDEPVPGYRLAKFLGRGGFGEVWMAHGPGGTAVALKFITLGSQGGDKEFRALRLVKQIRQANLTPIFSFWLKDSTGAFILDEEFEPSTQLSAATIIPEATPARSASGLIIAMGLGDKSLADRLQECKAEGLPGIPPRELIGYMRDAAKAIDFLNSTRHDLGRGTELGRTAVGIQHCDIKPLNMLIVGNAVQVCDFGLARVLDDMRATTPAFSLAYTAPEFIDKNTPASTTDQYSLAISYVELRTGALPFGDRPTPGSVLQAHLQSKLDLSKLPPGEQAAVRRATMRDPAARFPTSGEFVEAIRRAIDAEEAGRTESRRNWFIGAVAVVVVLALAAVAFRPQPTVVLPSSRTPAYFTVSVSPSQAMLDLGTTSTLTIHFNRNGVTKPIKLDFLDVPGGIVIESESSAVAGDRRVFRLTARDSALPGTQTIRVAAEVDDLRQEYPLEVTIQPLWLPNADFTAEPQYGLHYSGGRTYARRIVFRRDELEIPFVFVPRTHNDDPTDFYIMEQKVSNGQFRRYAELHSDRMHKSQWEQGGVAREKSLGAANPKLPVLHVRCDEAWGFALWVGGRLPTLDQWNKAAGVNEPRTAPGPYKATADGKPDGLIAVGRADAGPAEVGSSSADVSLFGCRDMAGNGWEWTRSTLDGNLSQPPNTSKGGGTPDAGTVFDVVLRGRSYLAKQPATFAELADKQDLETFTYDQADPCIGFRVVFDTLLP
jgi:serine/threonine protein kinase